MEIESVRYPPLVRWVHWASAALVLVANLTGESAEDLNEGGGQWHAFAGLVLLALFVPRLVGYMARPKPTLLREPTRPAERLASFAIHLALALFLLVQPVLGILAVWGEGRALSMPFTTWSSPPMLTIGQQAAHRLEEAHEILGTVFYAVIGIHVFAALWHHYVRRDGVLRRML